VSLKCFRLKASVLQNATHCRGKRDMIAGILSMRAEIQRPPLSSIRLNQEASTVEPCYNGLGHNEFLSIAGTFKVFISACMEHLHVKLGNGSNRRQTTRQSETRQQKLANNCNSPNSKIAIMSTRHF